MGEVGKLETLFLMPLINTLPGGCSLLDLKKYIIIIIVLFINKTNFTIIK